MASCGSAPERETALAEAFAGPIELKLREDVTPGTKTVATAKHGDKLQVLQVRRRFVRVRTSDGAVGWTDVRQLMTVAQMTELKQLAEFTAKLPSQGEAAVYGTLNVHTMPSRQSPSFMQIQEGVRVHALAHQAVARSGGAPAPAFSIPKPPPPVRKKKEKDEPKVPPPPKAPAPALPGDWMDLSRTDLPGEPEANPQTQKTEPVRMEDWMLIRTTDGKAGWVLSRNLMLAIPDEVAQYSEGHRITSYFSLGSVNDNGEIKHNWLWTTLSKETAPYEYDGFRVFVWVLRKHRYETAYIERGVKGYYPTSVESGASPRFTLLLEEEDGQVFRKTFAFEGHLVRKTAQEAAKKPEPLAAPGSISAAPEPQSFDGSEKKGIGDRLKGLFGKS